MTVGSHASARAPHTHTGLLGAAQLATHNLANISTLARTFMIWKDQDVEGWGPAGLGT